MNSGGDHERYKARLVADGFKQKSGIDFLHTYAPLVSLSTVRLVLSFAAAHNYEIHQLDVVAAFLQSEIKEEIYLQLPLGFGIVGGTIQDASLCRVAYTGKREPACVRIVKSLYGLRQSALNWYGKLDSELIRNGFRNSDWEAGVYYQVELVLLVWVDDILLAGGRSAVQATRKVLENTFTIRDMGPIAHFLGMRVTRDLRTKVISLDQSGYISLVLRRFQMDGVSDVSASLDPGMSLLKRNGMMTTVVEEEGAMRKEENLLRDDQIEEQVDQKEYQEIVGSLNYAAIATRPDISFAVGVLGRYASDPARRHMIMTKRVMRYLSKTVRYQLNLGVTEGLKEPYSTVALYTDSDFAGDPNSMKSTTAMVIRHRYGLMIALQSKKQSITAKSTADAEYMATATSIDEGVWVHKLNHELHESLPVTQPFPHQQHTIRKSLPVSSDNQANIKNAKLGEHQTPSKTVGVKFHWIKDQVRDGTIMITYIPTTEMIADGFTKIYGKVKQAELVEKLGLTSGD